MNNRIRTVAGGGRAVEIAAPRVSGWFARFAERHGGAIETELSPWSVLVRTRDGANAQVAVPFGPLAGPAEGFGVRSGLAVSALVAHLNRSRLLGVVLVRLGGYSIGVTFAGKVLASTTDRRQVHGRNRAGGWSQQRFARRREGQARVALDAAAGDIERLLGPRLAELDAVVLGGDPHALALLRTRTALAPVFALAEPRVLDVPEPRRAVLDDAAVRACGVEIIVREP